MVEKRKRKLAPLVWMGAGVLIIVAAVALVFNLQTIKDLVAGMGYQPVVEMAEIRETLGLTGRGERIFNASRPELNERGDFNRNCRDNDTETAILGCYRNEKIYIYNIVDEELDGIRELTTAHELLHAVYARMSRDERERWRPVLEGVYQDNLEILQEEIKNYEAHERLEEIYVRAGTEVKDLPAELEAHFAEIFTNQDAVVGLYERYIAAFLAVEAKIEQLDAEMTAKRAAIDEKTSEYERRAAQLSADVVSFNSCAAVAGCFKTEEEFTARRGVLISEQEALGELYEDLNVMIDDYNDDVAEYNENLLHGQMLNNVINSAVEPEAVE